MVACRSDLRHIRARSKNSVTSAARKAERDELPAATLSNFLPNGLIPRLLCTLENILSWTMTGGMDVGKGFFRSSSMRGKKLQKNRACFFAGSVDSFTH